uniref:Uncharacterized protein n=1 Tax=Knipowitschia caucasica TaxID=637954 RepID=A0AAV2M1C6_KNICA
MEAESSLKRGSSSAIAIIIIRNSNSMHTICVRLMTDPKQTQQPVDRTRVSLLYPLGSARVYGQESGRHHSLLRSAAARTAPRSWIKATERVYVKSRAAPAWTAVLSRQGRGCSTGMGRWDGAEGLAWDCTDLLGSGLELSIITCGNIGVNEHHVRPVWSEAALIGTLICPSCSSWTRAL